MNPAHADSDPVSITNRTRDECSGLATLGWPQTEAGRHRPPATGLDKQKEPAVVTEFKLTPNAVRTPRAAAVAGILFALLLGTALVLLRHAVPAHPADSGTWLTDSSHRNSVRLALHLVPFAGIAFLWFMGAARDRLGDKEDKFFATLFLGSGFLFVGMLFVLAALAGGLLDLAAEHQGRPPMQVWEFGRPAAYIVLTTCVMRMAGVFAIATSTIALRTGLLFRWLALTGFLVGLLSLFAVGPVPWLELAFPIWILAINISILAVSRSSRPAESVSNLRRR